MLTCHSLEIEQNNKISFLDANDIREQGKFITSAHRKPTLNGLCLRFDSFLPDTYLHFHK